MDGGRLHPIRGADRVWRYPIDEVRQLLQPAGEPGLDGETAAAAFAMFESRKSVAKVVVALKRPPAMIIGLRREYDDMKNSLILPRVVVIDLRRMLGRDFRNGRELVEAIRDALDRSYQEGRSEAEECGRVLDPMTGKMRPVRFSDEDRPAQLSVPPSLPAEPGSGEADGSPGGSPQ